MKINDFSLLFVINFIIVILQIWLRAEIKRIDEKFNYFEKRLEKIEKTCSIRNGKINELEKKFYST